MVTKAQAVARLRAHGALVEAQTLDDWRSLKGTAQGWDGHVRKAFPRLVPVIWR